LAAMRVVQEVLEAELGPLTGTDTDTDIDETR
jgi:hypothetical protein